MFSQSVHLLPFQTPIQVLTSIRCFLLGFTSNEKHQTFSHEPAVPRHFEHTQLKPREGIPIKTPRHPEQNSDTQFDWTMPSSNSVREQTFQFHRWEERFRRCSTICFFPLGLSIFQHFLDHPLQQTMLGLPLIETVYIFRLDLRFWGKAVLSYLLPRLHD